MRNTSLWVPAVVAIACACGCKAKAAAEQLGTFTCKDVQDDACVGPTDHFDAAAPIVYMRYRTTDLPRTGDSYAVQWIAEDVGQAAPANTVIATTDEAVKDVPAGAQTYALTAHLTKPTNGWPVGKYRVEVKLGGKLVTTAHFAIQ